MDFVSSHFGRAAAERYLRRRQQQWVPFLLSVSGCGCCRQPRLSKKAQHVVVTQCFCSVQPSNVAATCVHFAAGLPVQELQQHQQAAERQQRASVQQLHVAQQEQKELQRQVLELQQQRATSLAAAAAAEKETATAAANYLEDGADFFQQADSKVSRLGSTDSIGVYTLGNGTSIISQQQQLARVLSRTSSCSTGSPMAHNGQLRQQQLSGSFSGVLATGGFK